MREEKKILHPSQYDHVGKLKDKSIKNVKSALRTHLFHIKNNRKAEVSSILRQKCTRSGLREQFDIIFTDNN